MPFKSQAQRRYLYAKHPEVAKKFAAHTPKGAKLPEHACKTCSGRREVLDKHTSMGPKYKKCPDCGKD